MIQVETLIEDWPAGVDWSGRAQSAAEHAVLESPYASVIEIPGCVIEISLRLTSDDEVRTLNRQYRQQDKPTNVLSFPMVEPDLIDTLDETEDAEVLLGDIVLAYGVCAREAEAKGVPLADHATHLIVHGVLHLLGYDHMTDAEAAAMEAIERAAMSALGLHDPYEDSETPE